jgi:hypothetical protein
MVPGTAMKWCPSSSSGELVIEADLAANELASAEPSAGGGVNATNALLVLAV